MTLSSQSAPTTPLDPRIDSLRLSELIGALSYALDLTEGQPAGHCIRACWIGMHVGRQLGYDEERSYDLFYTLLLKDAGCSSNAARLFELYGVDDHRVKQHYKVVDNQHYGAVARFVFQHVGVHDPLGRRMRRLWFLAQHGETLADEVVETRCERGADIAIELGFSSAVADGIRHLDEHWNGRGRPYGKAGDEISPLAQIALLSQVVDVFLQSESRAAAIAEVRSRRGSWFGSEFVDALLELAADAEFWEALGRADIDRAVMALEPAHRVLLVDEDRMDRIAEAFALVVDAKSNFTADHSRRVAEFTDAVANEMGYVPGERRWLRRAALLHDIGKLGVSNAILDKPGRLTDEEWVHVREHARLSEEILGRVGPFAELARVAAAHHERLDGKGYPRGLSAEDISLETRMITVADIFDAITAERPYRGPIPTEKALEIMQSECPAAIDPDCLAALRRVVG